MILEGLRSSTFLEKILHRNFSITESLFSVTTEFFILKCQYCESIWERSGITPMAGGRSLQSCWETLVLHLKMLLCVPTSQMAPWEEIAFTLADRGDLLGTASKASVDYRLNSVHSAEVAV